MKLAIEFNETIFLIDSVHDKRELNFESFEKGTTFQTLMDQNDS